MCNDVNVCVFITLHECIKILKLKYHYIIKISHLQSMISSMDPESLNHAVRHLYYTYLKCVAVFSDKENLNIKRVTSDSIVIHLWVSEKNFKIIDFDLHTFSKKRSDFFLNPYLELFQSYAESLQAPCVCIVCTRARIFM